jgi:hypothetical protein
MTVKTCESRFTSRTQLHNQLYVELRCKQHEAPLHRIARYAAGALAKWWRMPGPCRRGNCDATCKNGWRGSYIDDSTIPSIP